MQERRKQEEEEEEEEEGRMCGLRCPRSPRGQKALEMASSFRESKAEEREK